MTYYFIAINFNNSHHTVKYIENICALKASGKSKKKIIIVDNNSNDSLDDIKESLKTANLKTIESILIENKDNSGYFSGLNIGIRAIDKSEMFMAIVGNNDLLFDGDFLQTLEGLNLKKHDYCIAPNVYLPDGLLQNPHVLKKPSKFSRFLHGLYFSNYYLGQIMIKLNRKNKKRKRQNVYKAPLYIHGGIGAVYILTHFFFDKNSELNAPVFLYGEEVILTHQIQTTGGKMLYHPGLKVLHNEHSTVSKLGKKKIHKLGKQSYKIYRKYY